MIKIDMKEEKIEENEFNKSSKIIQELLKKKKLLKHDSSRIIDKTYLLSEGHDNKLKNDEEEQKIVSNIKDNVAVLLNQYEQQYLISQSINSSSNSNTTSGDNSNNSGSSSGGGGGFKSLFKRFNKKDDKPNTPTKESNNSSGGGSNEMNKNIDKNYMFIVSGVQCKSKLPKLDNMVFNTLDELDIYLKTNNNNNNNSNNNNNNSTVDHHKVLLELLCEIILPMITVEGVMKIYDNKITFEGTKLGGVADLSQQALSITKYFIFYCFFLFLFYYYFV